MVGSNNPRKQSGSRRSPEEDDPDGKKKKNRDAARKCREKKVAETDQLKKKNQELMEKNKGLESKKLDLEKKLRECINEILEHRASGCSLPNNVIEIIKSVEILESIPVNTQTISVMNNQTKPSYPVESIFNMKSVSSSQQQATGLFSGLPTDHGRIRTRNVSSSSSTRSTPPPVSPLSQPSTSSSSRVGQIQATEVVNRNVNSAKTETNQLPLGIFHHYDTNGVVSPGLSSAQATSLSNNTVNLMGKLTCEPSWISLHQHTLIGERSETPGLSPVQTVPNLDLWSVKNYATNGFLDSKDDVVMDEDSTRNSPFSGVLSPSINQISSLGFEPTLNSISSLESQSDGGIQGNIYHAQQNRRLAKLTTNTLKPNSSAPVNVSMHHTAELLSQAITNFDDSEISDEIKLQYQLAKTGVIKNSQENQSFVQNKPYIQEQNNCAVQQEQVILSPNSGNRSMSLETLLNLAKNHEENITIQFQGKEFHNCSYDLLKQIISGFPEFGNNNQYETDTSESSAMIIDAQHTANNFPNNTLEPVQQEVLSNMYTICSGPNEIFFQNNSVDQGLNPSPIVSQGDEVPIQDPQLPTTVLSMIQENSREQSVLPTTEPMLESVDYGENLKDLPSLSLTEDHTNIFEKKRKNN